MRSPALAGLLLLASCVPTTAPATTSAGAPTTTTATTVAPTTVAVTEPLLGCSDASDFLETGQVARIDQPSTDAATLGLISWDVIGGCERFRFDFDTNEGAPATTPPSVTVGFLGSGQILRIHLDVDRTVLTDQLVETPLVDRLYVVRSLDGGIFVDLHLAGPSQARAEVRNSPAGLAVELQMGIQSFTGAATIADQVVVIEPSPGEETGTTFEVNGYARISEGTVLVVVNPGGEEAGGGQSTQAADWAETWGEFETTLDVLPGTYVVQVGQEDPDDLSIAGASVQITAR